MDDERHERPRPSTDLRHDPARRRAVARDFAQRAGEARDRAAARAARRRRDRGRLPDHLARGLRGRPGDRARRSRPGRSRGLARDPPADIDAAWNAVRDAERPRIHTFISTSRHPHRAPAADHARGRARDRRGPPSRMPANTSRTSSSRRWTRLALGHRVHGRGHPDRARRGRDHDQHPGHRRLRDAARVRPHSYRAVQAGARAARRDRCRSTATTISASRSPTRSPGLQAGAARSSAR